MSLQPGDSLAHYRVVASLGAGGMGEVWRATDTRLHREVAVKVLPDSVAGDAERLARFEREAHLLAQLNHPNIAGIYGLEEAGGVHALVMELVEGPTLAERLELGALPLDDALDVARQIAEALEEAHEKGIVHRDLKPQNVKIAPGGRVKVLDFGLAKALDPMTASGSSASQLAHSPTLTLGGATQMGLILGTAAYMAPEQAAGGNADRRADVWAFGVVLYEMLAGRRLFEGETVSHVLAGVLKDQPDWSALPGDLPAPIRELLARCLQKDRRKRLQSIGDARVVIDEWRARPELLAPPAPIVVPASAPSRRAGLSHVLAALATLGIGLAAGSLLPRREPPPAEVEVGLALPAGSSVGTLEFPSIALSPDGRWRVAALADERGRQALAIAELGKADWRPLAGTEEATHPFFSPDGQWIAFFNRAELRKVSIQGGPPVTLARVSAQHRGGAWLDDDTIVFSPDAGTALLRISGQGGDARPLTTLDTGRGERTHRWPAPLPGGRLLFTCDTVESTEFYDDARIEALDADGNRKVLVSGSSQARFLPPDRLIYARGGTLFALRFDPDSLAPSGSPVPVLHGVATDVASGAVHFAVSPGGSLLWAPGGAAAAEGQPYRVSPDGTAAPLPVDRGLYQGLALAPDGQRLAVVLGDQQNLDLWVLDLPRRTRSRLTFGGIQGDPVWSPDGRRIAFAGRANGEGAGLFEKPADGSGESALILDTPGLEYTGTYAPDGRGIVFESIEGSSTSDLLLQRIGGTEAPLPIAADPRFTETMPDISPDGRLLAYASDETGVFEVFVRPFPTGSGKWQISTEGGLEPRWSPEGDALYFRNRGSILRVAVETRGGLVAAPAVVVFEGARLGANPRTYGVLPGGQGLVALRAAGADGARDRVNLAFDWGGRLRLDDSGRR
jgi:serine/threonine-protein kinase